MRKGPSMSDTANTEGVTRKLVKVTKEESRKGTFTPEMQELADALTHPEGDPYNNARKLGFYCEQCG